MGGTIKGESLPGCKMHNDKVEQEVAWCQEAMSSILNSMAMIIRIWTKLNGWWNTDTKERKQAVGRDIQRRRNSGEAVWANAQCQLSIWWSKCQM
jgi:hypothetical protein